MFFQEVSPESFLSAGLDSPSEKEERFRRHQLRDHSLADLRSLGF